jgi:beta-aspartyl-peptidase (threonine type)
MNKITIVVHGGAGKDSEYIRKHRKDYEEGLLKAVEAGYEILKNKGSALEAVEAAVISLEDNPFFNAGRGSAINAVGEVEMCASIMDGKTLNSGAVAIVRNVKNPISLAKSVMTNTDYIYLASDGAMNYAERTNIPLEPDCYFITEHQYDAYDKKRKESYDSNREVAKSQIKERYHGTVGAVAVDFQGNVAAATSSGGTEYAKEGRVGDSSMVGVGTYASNSTCAVSATGDGEYLIRGVITHSISSLMKYKNRNVSDACKEIIHHENKNIKGDIGVIAVDTNGNIAMEFNCERMHRAWRTYGKKAMARIYKDK